MNGMLRDRRLWLITIAVFLLLITVFDRNNLLDRWKLKQQIRELERQRTYYLEKIAEDSTLIERLKNDAFLEQYAREHYRKIAPPPAAYLRFAGTDVSRFPRHGGKSGSVCNVSYAECILPEDIYPKK